jgi:hypothetical protein
MHNVIVANEVPGAVTVVATRDSGLRMDTQGWADPETQIFQARGFDLLDRIHVKARRKSGFYTAILRPGATTTRQATLQPPSNLHLIKGGCRGPPTVCLNEEQKARLRHDFPESQ